MPVLSERDFDKLAARIVDQFLDGETKLADAAAKIASSSQLNPDQIERLVQSANTQTFLRMMDRRKEAGEEDLMHEFDPIDSRQVIRIVIDDAGVHINGPHDHGDDEAAGAEEGAEAAVDENELPDEMAALQQDVGGEEGGKDGPLEEAAEEAVEDVGAADELQALQEVKEEKEAALRNQRMRKLAGILEDQYLQHEWAFEEKFNDLATRFKRAHVELPFAEFEKDAFAETRDSVGATVLNALRGSQGLPELDLNIPLEKTAAFADHHVSDDSIELQMFEALTKLAYESQKVLRGLEWIRSQCA